jgi:hypothetical protein
MSKDYYLISPQGAVFSGRNLTRFCQENFLDQGSCVKVLGGTRLHCEGWCSSFEAHSIYIEAYLNRGIYWRKDNKLWAVQWRQHKGCNQSIKRFKCKNTAIRFRDSLEQDGYKFGIWCKDWKAKLKLISEQA